MESWSLGSLLDENTPPPVVDLVWLRECVSKGPLPDHPLLRQRVWRLLLGLRSLSPEKSSWKSTTSYNRYLDITNRVMHDSGPADDRLLKIISKDVSRMQVVTNHPTNASPFAYPTPSNLSSSESAKHLQQFPQTRFKQPINTPSITISEHDDLHLSIKHPKQVASFDIQSSLARILYFHAKLFPDRVYNQAWPSLLAPLYAVIVLLGPEFGDFLVSEAHCFWAFGELMGDVSHALDNTEGTESGTESLLRTFSARVRFADPDFWDILKRKGLDPSQPYWSFRYISCLLSQTLPLNHLITVWDLLLAQPVADPDNSPRLTFLIDVCTSMVLRLRSRLVIAGNRSYEVARSHEKSASDSTVEPWDGTMGDGFVEGMKVLQSYPIEMIGVSSILDGVKWLREKDARSLIADAERQRSAATSYSLANLRKFAWGNTPSESASTTRAGGVKTSRFSYFATTDAAAKLSKARSNLTAAAIDVWSGSASTPSRKHSLDEATGLTAREFSSSEEPGERNGRGSNNLTSAPVNNLRIHSHFSSLGPSSAPILDGLTPREFEDPPVNLTSASRVSKIWLPTSLGVRPQTPSPKSPAPRPLILSTHRVTRDAPLSRQSSVSSSSTAADGRNSDAEHASSRIVPLRRRRVTAGIPPSPASSASSLRSPDNYQFSPKTSSLGRPSPSFDAFSTPTRNRVLVDSPSSANSPSPPTPIDIPSQDWPKNLELETQQLGVPEDPSTGVREGSSTVRMSRLRAKRSLPLLDTLITEVEELDVPSLENSAKSPLTPRPSPLASTEAQEVPPRRPSPKPRRRKTSRGAHAPNPELPYLVSEEEGVKADDEDDYADLLSSYSTDTVGSN